MVQSSAATPSAELINWKRDLIYKAFEDLRNKYIGSSDWPCVSSIVPLDEATWTAGVTQLQSSLLPSLRNQITHLEKIMEPSDLRNDKGTKLDQISCIQSELDQTLYQIVSLVAVVRRRTLLSPADTDDRHLKELKGFRAEGLQSRVKSLVDTLCHVFIDCSLLIQLVKRTPQKLDTRVSNYKGLVTLIATQAVDKIDGVIKWLTGHEFNNIREDWEDYLPGINSVLFGVTRLINPTNDSDDHDGDGNESETFFKKLLRSGMKETPLQSFTEMSSHQIDTLGESARSVLYNLSQIRDALRNNDVENGDTEYIVNYMNEVLSDFDTSRLLVVFYVLPLIPDQVNHPSSQNPLTTWLVDWNHLLLIAVQNCISAVKLL
ncbi:hypothetical protein MJO28_006897 [Puccinia striiformis f. sp. tritici]|uniref:Uncharacterized protein n=1 Tax=Puccinia striiformis f. sp. tritici TaxID=168172 RepID=A0ACC0ECC2_9BASI|nr:hypothetical protein MJO28_006897 [Puccinia striiformis f. sp. tritici]